MLEWIVAVAKFPFVAIGKGFAWGRDLVAAPAKLKALESRLGANSDPRPICTACGKGKVTVKGRVELSPHSHMKSTRGQCEECSVVWRMSDSGDRLVYPW